MIPSPLAWIFSGLVAMLIGLLAAIGGALGHGNGHVLFVLALAPILPVVVAVFTGALTRMHP